MRTVECLRGRLLAERAASRNAKEEAELMGTRVCFLCLSFFFPLNFSLDIGCESIHLAKMTTYEFCLFFTHLQ